MPKQTTSYVHPVEMVENDVLSVSVIGADGSYFMWQKCLSEEAGSEDGVYFEFGTPTTGGHNQVRECTVTNDAIHVVLASGGLEHLYFPPSFDKHKELQEALTRIYAEQEEILEFSM